MHTNSVRIISYNKKWKRKQRNVCIVRSYRILLQQAKSILKNIYSTFSKNDNINKKSIILQR